MLQLVIGNKNYSSWSMRPWVLLRQLGIPFEEKLLRFDGFDADSRFKQAIGRVTPTGRVPVLVDEGFVVWDTLAIAEYLAERYPSLALWPADVHERARARSLCAEMHSGFGALRSHCPMNVEALLPEVGRRLWAEQ
ncbi:MAG TPA: glutathione S-transferase, partial [Burkholderiaceae bacterium]|nr:glutathione S-transferase [Burkholderiaceae bacterium]